MPQNDLGIQLFFTQECEKNGWVKCCSEDVILCVGLTHINNIILSLKTNLSNKKYDTFLSLPIFRLFKLLLFLNKVLYYKLAHPSYLPLCR